MDFDLIRSASVVLGGARAGATYSFLLNAASWNRGRRHASTQYGRGGNLPPASRYLGDGRSNAARAKRQRIVCVARNPMTHRNLVAVRVALFLGRGEVWGETVAAPGSSPLPGVAYELYTPCLHPCIYKPLWVLAPKGSPRYGVVTRNHAFRMEIWLRDVIGPLGLWVVSASQLYEITPHW